MVTSPPLFFDSIHRFDLTLNVCVCVCVCMYVCMARPESRLVQIWQEHLNWSEPGWTTQKNM
jgi:hypothetical protein